MRTWLKVCGIISVEEVQLAVNAGVNALGFVSEMPSGSGIIPDSLIAQIAVTVPPPMCRVLLTSRTDPDAVVEHVRMSPVDTVQLVDAVPIKAYAALRRFASHIRIVQAIHVEGREQYPKLKRSYHM